MSEQEMSKAGLERKARDKWGLLADNWSLARDERFKDQALQIAV